MNPETEGTEEQGPNRIPYVNDPGKRPPGAPVPDPDLEDESYQSDAPQVGTLEEPPKS
ncbi:hypothetical protein G7009_02100 [Pseudomonas capeferrum]|uniref:hypothetical protein n=1 Tax=Pseudomonas capeferrum TaxID=1495066 RepID=UPI0015E46BDE|nr:hypothetical protein [Pseudomonas capeferrum]MBA1200588.1 hypothetical protein [Pseudomonas capeferrum]